MSFLTDAIKYGLYPLFPRNAAGAQSADTGVRLETITPAEAASEKFTKSAFAYTQSAGSRLNQQYIEGWNVATNGQPLDTTKSSIGVTIESHFEPDLTHIYKEWYVQYYPPNSLTYQRPVSVGVNEVDGSIAVQLQFSTLNFLTAAGATIGSISEASSPIFSLSPPVNITAFQINGPTQTTAAIPLVNQQVTWNNAAAIFSGVVFNVTNTASNAASLLYDWQVGGSTKASVSVAGRVTAVNSFASPLYQFTSNTRMLSPSDGVIEFLNNASDNFYRVQLGGTTSSFPSIGRSTTRLVVQLADGTAGGGVNFSTAAVLSIASGTNQRAGNATLVGGTVTVSNTTVTANTVVILTRKTAGGTLGNLTYTLSAGTSFTINSDSGTDTSVVSYMLIEVP